MNEPSAGPPAYGTSRGVESRPTFLVLDPGSRHSLAVVRGIGRAGWQAVVAGVESRRDALAAASRYCVAYHRIPNPWHAGPPVEAAIRALVERYRLHGIVMCSDVTIARLRNLDLGVPMLPELGEGLDQAIDKLTLQRICAAEGVMYPRTASAYSAEWRRLPFPLIVKPRQTAVATPERVISRTGASVVHSEFELMSAVRELADLGIEPIVQERVGRAFKINVSFVRRHGTTSFQIAYRVLREHPHEGGLAATIETLDPDVGIGALTIQTAQRVCDAAGYAGLANVEFYGQNDGRMCLIEINPRVWGSIGFPEQLGLRPTERAIHDVLDLPPEKPLSYRAGRRFHRPTLEVKAFLRPAPIAGSRRDVVLSIRPWDVFDGVSVSDPVPVAVAVRQTVQRGIRMLARSITRR